MPGSGHAQGASWSVLMHMSYHKEHEYIWLRGGDLNRFRESKPFMK